MYTLLFNNKNLHLIECDQENRHSNNTTETSIQTIYIYLHDLPLNEITNKPIIYRFGRFSLNRTTNMEKLAGKRKKNLSDYVVGFPPPAKI